MTQVGKLEYDLTDPDARREFELALAAPKLSIFIWDLLQELRNEAKYGKSEIGGTDGQPPTSDDVRTWMFDELASRGLTEIVEG